MTKIFILKNIILGLLLIIFVQSSAQDSLNAAISYQEVVKVDSTISSKELYLRARSWFAETYKSSQDVIQMDDKESGKIIGKGAIKYYSNVFVGSEGTKGFIFYTITVQVKDGRYKYEITDFNHEGNPYNSGGQLSFGLITNSDECPYKVGTWTSKAWRNKVWKDIKNRIDENIPILIQSLKDSMNKPAKNSNSDW